MPGVYIANRGGHPGRAGLMLPYTPTTGPIQFGGVWHDFQDVPMHRHYSGPVAGLAGLGARTHLISQCAVFIAAERVATGWGDVFFTHAQGGFWGGRYAGRHAITADASAQALVTFANRVNRAQCYTVAIIPGEAGYGSFVTKARELGFPPENMSLYVSNTSGGLGIALGFGGMLGEFGEVDNPSTAPTGETRFGYRPGIDPYCFFD